MKFNRREFLKIGASVSLAPWASQVFSKTCATGESTVLVGGVIGFDSLANPMHSRALRQTCRAGLYIHGYIWTRTGDEEHKAILSAFEGQPMDVELGMVSTPEKWFENNYRPQFLDAGVRAKHAHVNGFNPQSADVWPRFVKAGQACGLKTIAPIFSPNHHQYDETPFSSPSWNYLRDGAKLGGALTTDSPPQFFLHQPPGYRRFVAEELQWANETGLHSTFIVSPASSGDKFLDDTKRTVDYLSKSNALPKTWIVENYDPKVNSAYVNAVGSDNNKDSILGVALWLAQNAN
ncbi:hypothetical protein [Burkholderia sp. Bp9031]|uniref:hypothetical protein n=1 Tax=Burkholderia sp. Bp9031 TaxID=2184566 RepID=UPI000F5F1D38|nr:hypothetical protein [Burkholderia sp. Bp9031]